MQVKILDLTRQYQLLKEQAEAAVCEQMATGMFIGGKAVADFEEKFARYIGVKHAISVNSGTDALVIALKALGIGQGDEVITTPFSFFATAETIAMAGALPVFADIDGTSYNLDPSKIEEKITPRTKAILPVHIFGQCADMPRISRIAEKHGLSVIEDACQAVGSGLKTEDGKWVMAGALGDLGCFSFFPTKNLGAFGDAGMITTNDDNLAVICRAYKEHGRAQNGAKARFLLEGVEDELEGTVSPDGLYNPYKYYNYLIGYNSRMDAIQARILTIKLDYLEQFNKRRAQIAEFYSAAFRDVKGIRVPATAPGVGHVWHQYALCCDRKDELGSFLASKGVGSAAFYPVPLHLQKAFAGLGYREGDLPVAEKITKQTVCLPIFPELTQEELDYVAQCVKEFCAQ